MRMGNSTEESVIVAHKEKTCSKCKETKSVDEFNKDNSKPDGLRYRCRVCDKTCKKLCNCCVDPNLKEKTCSKCKETKSVDEFWKNKRSPDGLQNSCRACYVKYQKLRHFSVDPNLKEKICSKCEETRPLAEFTKRRRSPDGLNNVCKACKPKYTKEDKIKINKRERQRYETDILYKLSKIIRSQNNRIFNETKLEKTKRSFKNLGCTIVEFKKHMESQFVEGMSWENHGHDNDNIKRWHSDHIIPVSYFIKNSDDPFRANNYRNQRPMWGKENMSKSDTLDMELVKEYGIEDLLPHNEMGF